MSWNEHVIAAAVAEQTLRRSCVVLVDRCKWTGHECDLLAVTTDLRIIDVEVKISRSDFKADASKYKWWIREYIAWGQPPANEAREWPPKVWKHYYAVPREVWTDDLFDAMPSKASGVLLADMHRGAVVINSIRPAKPNPDAYRLTPQQAIDVARLANVRMWGAYARDEAATTHIEKLKREVSSYRRRLEALQQ